MHKLTALAAAVGLGASALVGLAPQTSATAQPAAPASPVDALAADGAPAAVRQAVGTPGKVRWGRCADGQLRRAGAQCGTVKVPLSYRKPKGKKIRVAVSRVRHTSSAADYRGVMVVNPGGPGGEGLYYATLGAFVPGGVGGRYDWIGFDPRGVGASRPAIRCDKDYFGYDRPDYVTRTKKQERVWRKRSRAYAKSCAKKYPRLLRNMKTKDVARDVDRIRRAVGAKKISFYGFSYGTYLGQVYASRFPRRVDRMVMDATVDPRHVWYRSNLDQSRAFQRNMNRWFAWVAEHHDYYELGRTKKQVRRAWYQDRRALAKTPAGGRIGPSEWTDTFLYAGYYESTWLDLADAWWEWRNDRDWRGVKDFYAEFNTPRDDNGYAAYLAVECTDATWPRSWKKWRRDARKLHRQAPFMAWTNTWFNAPCQTWKAAPGKARRIKGNQTDVLLVHERWDAATPYAGALEVRKRFKNSSLVAVPGGTTHAGSLNGHKCVDDAVARFLATGEKPARRPGRKADLRCERLPRPDPGGSYFGLRAVRPPLSPLPPRR